MPQPRDAKKRGDITSYNVLARSGDRKLPLYHALFVVTAGDYVLAGASPGPGGQVFNSFCLGGPAFRVPEGAVVYVGDFTPYILVEQADGSRVNAMAWSFHPDDARAALAGQPALAGALQDAGLVNGATWGCAAVTMMAYAVPGAPTLAAADTLPGQAPAPATATPAPATILTVPAGG